MLLTLVKTTPLALMASMNAPADALMNSMVTTVIKCEMPVTPILAVIMAIVPLLETCTTALVIWDLRGKIAQLISRIVKMILVWKMQHALTVSMNLPVSVLPDSMETFVTWKSTNVLQIPVVIMEHALRKLMATSALVSLDLTAHIARMILTTVCPVDVRMAHATMELTILHAVAILASLVDCVIMT